MEFQNHFLREALCAFRYDVAPDQAEPAVEYVHRFYSQLKEQGFTAQQQQPFELTVRFEATDNPEAIKPEVSKGQPSLVLRNETTGYAIIIGAGLISFNCLKPYPGWTIFLAELVEQYLPVYAALGISQQLKAVQMAYINDFELAPDESAHDYLSHLPQLAEIPEAITTGHASQSHFQVEPTTVVTLQTQLLVGQPGTSNRVILECNATSTPSPAAPDELALANKAHTAARAAFMSVATAKYKAVIA